MTEDKPGPARVQQPEGADRTPTDRIPAAGDLSDGRPNPSKNRTEDGHQDRPGDPTRPDADPTGPATGHGGPDGPAIGAGGSAGGSVDRGTTSGHGSAVGSAERGADGGGSVGPASGSAAGRVERDGPPVSATGSAPGSPGRAAGSAEGVADSAMPIAPATPGAAKPTRDSAGTPGRAAVAAERGRPAGSSARPDTEQAESASGSAQRDAGSDAPSRSRGSGGSATKSEPATVFFDESVVSRFRDRWRALQADFVDDPARAVRNADELVDEIIHELAERKQNLEHQWRDGPGDTEELRVAIREYRSFFNQLLNA